ncbi:MAG TPA: hypothetical protein VGK58_06550, partial [Lacipirellulaceae bacterium]
SVDTVRAQRGTGELQGIARQADKPAVETIAGTLKQIKTDPCAQTTGRSPIGTHLILEGENKTYNVHLGPASEVGDVVGMVRVDDTVEATVFRTPRLPENQYVAVSVKLGDKEIVLRDDSLRPRWARTSGGAPGQQAVRGGRSRAAGRGARRLAFSRVLAQSSELNLTDAQVDTIEEILAEAENRIRDVLTDEQLNALDSLPRGGQGRGRGPRWADR